MNELIGPVGCLRSKLIMDQLLFGRKLPKVAASGDSKEILKIFEKGDFGVDKYNESYQSFVEKQHRKEGLDIVTVAHEKFPNDAVGIFHLEAMVPS